MASPAFNLSELPNPLTNLAFLPPDLAFETQVARYFLVGGTAIFIWDILSHLHDDYKLLFKYKVGLPTSVYFFSKLMAFTYCLGSMLIETTPVGHCFAIIRFLCIVYPLATSSTCLLFFFRIRAVFSKEKKIIAAFFVLWLAVLGSNLAVVTAVDAIFIGPTQYCLLSHIQSYAFLASVFVAIHDFFVFAAISYRLARNSHLNANTRDMTRAISRGDSLPHLSKVLLLDSQLYFVITVSINIVATILCYTTSIPPTFRTMLTVPNIMLSNVMAGHVFRHTKFTFAPSLPSTVVGTTPSFPMVVRNNTSGTQTHLEVTVAQSSTSKFDYGFKGDSKAYTTETGTVDASY